MSSDSFRVRLTADFFERDKPKYEDIGVSTFDAHPRIKYSYFGEHRPEITADQIAGAHGIIVLTPAVTRATVAGAVDTLAIGRFGVGYDLVDVQACTEADIAVFIAAGAVDRPVAEGTLCWMLGLSHHVLIKDRLVRTGEWDTRSKYMGTELRERTLGVIGCGGIARELIRLTRGFGMKQPLAYSPSLNQARADEIGVRAVGMDELLRNADFVSIHCPLKEETRGLIGKRELSLMKPCAFLLNTARGPIVDEDALFEALQTKRIAGAAIDCFAGEPLTKPHRFGQLDNVLLAPHAIAWTYEMFRDIGRTAATGMVEIAYGRKPHGLVNPQVWSRPGFQRKLSAYALI